MVPRTKAGRLPARARSCWPPYLGRSTIGRNVINGHDQTVHRGLTSHCSRRRAVRWLGAEAPFPPEMHGVTPLADAARRLDVSCGKRRAALPLGNRGLAAAE